MTAIVSSDDFNLHDNSHHPERAERLITVINYLKNMPFYNRLSNIAPKMVSETLLLDVHTQGMINRIKNSSGWLDHDTYVSIRSHDVARLAAGAVVCACDAVSAGKIDNAFALVRPPGHHATQDTSMGFCLYNNGAVAANNLTTQGKRVLIFDHDVHHGNGTANIFFERNDVLYQSFHLFPHYPGTGHIGEIGTGKGAGYTINAPLRRGVGNTGVRRVIEEIMLPIAKQFKPDLIIVSAGFDSHHMDTLGGLGLTLDFYGEIITHLLEVQPKLVSTLEGGYNLDVLSKGVAVELATLLGTPIKYEDSFNDYQDTEDVIIALKKTLDGYWSL